MSKVYLIASAAFMLGLLIGGVVGAVNSSGPLRDARAEADTLREELIACHKQSLANSKKTLATLDKSAAAREELVALLEKKRWAEEAGFKALQSVNAQKRGLGTWDGFVGELREIEYRDVRMDVDGRPKLVGQLHNRGRIDWRYVTIQVMLLDENNGFLGVGDIRVSNFAAGQKRGFEFRFDNNILPAKIEMTHTGSTPVSR